MLKSYGRIHSHALVAQWIEHQLAVLGVGGSSPPGRTKIKTHQLRWVFIFTFFQERTFAISVNCSPPRLSGSSRAQQTN